MILHSENLEICKNDSSGPQTAINGFNSRDVFFQHGCAEPCITTTSYLPSTPIADRSSAV